MSIVAAKCPVCGRDIGFDETAAEYTCIFCGARLKTAALKCEKPVKAADRAAGRTEAHSDVAAVFERHVGNVTDRDRVTAEGLSEEEIEAELSRKVGLKEELRLTVKEIDALRKKRDPIKAMGKRMNKAFAFAGLFLAIALIAFFFVFGSAEKYRTPVMIASAVVFVLGLALIVYAAVRKRRVASDGEKLEENITAKKSKRDGIIDELNAINKKLGIHHHDK